ncbi:twin-arginine translocation signal domain-containing protein (plasmid) [Halarchaeum sp. CBA1220]|uniref:twin-arginine translocation signal domain-containing protein n=1 Tax=Halarchaeum sp. CBA1220 TaxID=1853682 RepID=UPI000F3A8451|nr:twin-arginine translocation signal domain-containing protein [Halarchaeum sp. CBA1220]QLC35374.1 twin-arginine translocation signal domain-containing protein [Halarchaeum sp. CBA1220]
MKRRNFVKYAGGTAAAAGLAGCTGGGDDGGGDTTTDGTTTTGGGGDSGSRPVQWIAPAWAGRSEITTKYNDVTGIDLEITTATNSTTQQRVLSGGRSTLDAFTTDSANAGAITSDNDASYAIPTADLPKWSSEKMADLFTDPGETLSFLGEQTETYNDLMWEDEEQTELRFPPTICNFDAMGSNPKYVDDVSKWGALFDDQYEGQVAINGASATTIPETLMYLLDNDMVEGDVGSLNNPTEQQIDTTVDFLVDQKSSGQFRSTWTAYGTSVNLMSSEEAVIGDIWQPACLDVRRSGTPCEYATMSEGIQGYRYWYAGIAPLKPGAQDRNNMAEVQSLINDVHWSAWFPGYIQNWGYSVPHYTNTDLVRDGSDDTGEGMGPEYYDWAYEGAATYDSVENPALFDPQSYEWSMEEGEPADDGCVRDSGPIEERINRIGFFQIWPDNATHMLERWQEFKSA